MKKRNGANVYGGGGGYGYKKKAIGKSFQHKQQKNDKRSFTR